MNDAEMNDEMLPEYNLAQLPIIRRGPGHERAGRTRRRTFMQPYVEQRDGDYYIVGTRVLLDGLVYGWLAGQSAETIAQSFPTLKLEEVYGAIAFYLGRRDEVDRYLRQREADFEARRLAARESDPAFYQKLADVRRQMETVTR